MQKEKIRFEDAVARLEEISALLERPDTELDRALELFKESVTLTALCNNRLSAAEAVVRELRGQATGEEG